MKILEDLRFHSIPRFLTKKYISGTNRHIPGRPHNGFIFCLEGEVNFIYNGKSYKCDNSHVLLAPKDSVYDLHVDRDTLIYIIDFELDAGFFHEMYLFEIKGSDTFYKSFLKMERRYIYHLESKELIALSELYDITARINGYGYHDEKYRVIEKSEVYLKENAFKDFEMAKAASASNISEVYFRKLFKEKYGISPSEYVAELRISKAKDLLLNEDKNVSEIAQECGFASLYSFSRAFKDNVGMSPNKFRRIYTVVG